LFQIYIAFCLQQHIKHLNSQVKFQPTRFLLPKNRLCFLHKVKKHLVGSISNGIAGYPALGAKIILRAH